MTTNYPDPDRLPNAIRAEAILVSADRGVTVIVTATSTTEHSFSSAPWSYEHDGVEREIDDFHAQGFVEWEA